MKRATMICAASALVAAALMLTACTMGNPGATPTPTPAITPTPAATLPPTTPTPIESPIGSPVVTGGTGIPDFLEGKVVQPDDVPDIVAAIEAKYAGASIQSITHALHLDEQVYEVVFKEGTATKTVYVSHDGATVTESEGSPLPTT